MKKREQIISKKQIKQQRNDLMSALAQLTDPADIEALLLDLCTSAEIEAMVDRLAVVPHLAQGKSYRAIHRLTGVSLTTIGRVAHARLEGQGGYAKVVPL